MKILQAPTIFDSFNARALKPAEVALTFVPSTKFKQLSKRCHTVIIGPRGSGKTTLLKMLQQPALEAWDHTLANEYRSSIDFTGVFIATDLSWGGQLEALGEGKLDHESHKLLSRSAFTTHVLKSLVTAMINRISRPDTVIPYAFRRIELSDEDEVKLVRYISEAWKIKPEIPSLLSLKQTLGLRLLKIREIASKEVTLGEDGRKNRLGVEDFLHLHFVEASSIATDTFNDLIRDLDGKWALLFDELELAPQWIQDELFRSLRSTDSKFLFKLAMSPLTGTAGIMESSLSPAPDHDFEQIPLWYAEKNQSYGFCKNLWFAMLKARKIEQCNPDDILGPSYFESSNSDERSEIGATYAPNSKLGKRFVKLAEKDPSFQNYLKEKGINPRAIHLVDRSTMDAVVRKIAPIVTVREFYKALEKETHERKIKRRSRKNATLYAGAESLFAVSEGNPRWFIAIIGRLLDIWSKKGGILEPGIQGDEMLKAAQRFLAMLRTIPTPGSAIGMNRGLLTVITTVGKYFHRQIVSEEFIADPIATFKVDSTTDENLLRVLGQALNAGAIVYVPDSQSNLLLTSLSGKRFRISYMLAPHYGIPLRLGTELNLSRILEKQDGKVSQFQLYENPNE